MKRPGPLLAQVCFNLDRVEFGADVPSVTWFWNPATGCSDVEVRQGMNLHRWSEVTPQPARSWQQADWITHSRQVFDQLQPDYPYKLECSNFYQPATWSDHLPGA